MEWLIVSLAATLVIVIWLMLRRSARQSPASSVLRTVGARIDTTTDKPVRYGGKLHGWIAAMGEGVWEREHHQSWPTGEMWGAA